MTASKTPAKTVIPGYGPSDAAVVWIGEAPGREEVLAGRPFIGPSGRMVRNALRAHDYDPDSVYYDNAIPVNPGPLTDKRANTLLDTHRSHLDAVLARMSTRVVVACGTVALKRILGWGSVMAWHGSLAYRADSLRKDDMLCGTTPVIPIIHPASILRDPSRNLLRSFIDVVGRACEVAESGPTQRPTPYVREYDFSPLRDARAVVLDTEFNAKTYELHLVGMADVDRPEVVYFPTSADDIRSLLGVGTPNPKPVIAHNVVAEIRSLAGVGVDITQNPLLDTMHLWALVEPDLPRSLSFMARSLVEGCCEWKHLGHQMGYYKLYCAYDVMYTGLAYAKLPLKELELPYTHVAENIVRMMRMEDEGLLVSPANLKALKQAMRHVGNGALSEIHGAVKRHVDERVACVETAIAEADAKIADAHAAAAHEAEEAYAREQGELADITWRVKPRGKKRAYYDRYIAPVHAALEDTKKERRKNVRLLEDLREHGFRPTNDNDMRWYLNTVAKRPKGARRVRTRTGLLSIDMTTLGMYRDDPVVRACWRYRHIQKVRSTFIEGKVGVDGRVNPRIRLDGTATGRPSSGGGDASFNAFNIPEYVRAIFVPPEGYVFVGADISDMEGRLVALDSGDEELCRLYREGVDVHSFLAGHAFGIDPATARDTPIRLAGTTHSARYLAKRVAHGIRYGMGVAKLAKTLRIPRKEAARIFDIHNRLFPGVVAWQEAIVTEVFGKAIVDDSGAKRYISQGSRVLKTEWGRRRYFLGHEDACGDKALAHRPQSHGADVWFTILGRLCRPGSTALLDLPGRFVTGTYDSFLLEVPRDHAPRARGILEDAITQPIHRLTRLPGASLMPVSMPCESYVGDNYAFVEDVPTYVKRVLQEER